MLMRVFSGILTNMSKKKKRKKKKKKNKKEKKKKTDHNQIKQHRRKLSLT